jgi:hypothetical protein
LALACCEPSCATWSYLSTNWRTCFKWRAPRQFSVISSQLSVLCAAIKLGCPGLDFQTRETGLIRTRATRRPKKQSESVSFPPRSPKARDLHPTDEDLSLHPSAQRSCAGDPESVGTPNRGHPDCGGDCTRRPWPPAVSSQERHKWNHYKSNLPTLK